MNLEEWDPGLAEELQAKADGMQRIWIQVYEHDEWTWCRHPVGPTDGIDVEYVRANKYERLQADNERLRDNNEILIGRLETVSAVALGEMRRLSEEEAPCDA